MVDFFKQLKLTRVQVSPKANISSSTNDTIILICVNDSLKHATYGQNLAQTLQILSTKTIQSAMPSKSNWQICEPKARSSTCRWICEELPITGVGRTIISIQLSNLYRSNLKVRCNNYAAVTVDCISQRETWGAGIVC